MVTQQDTSRDRVRGALFGLAMGDALGAFSEGLTPQQISEKFGWITDFLKLDQAELFALSAFHDARYLYIEIPGRKFEGNYPALIVALAHGERVTGIEPLLIDPSGSLFEITAGKQSAVSYQLSAEE